MRIVSGAIVSMLLVGTAAAADLDEVFPDSLEIYEAPLLERPVLRYPRFRAVGVVYRCDGCGKYPLPWGGLRRPRVVELPWGGLRDGCAPPLRAVRRVVLVRKG